MATHTSLIYKKGQWTMTINKNIPPVLEEKTFAINLGKREGLIMGISLILALMISKTIGFGPLKWLLISLVVLSGLALSIGRDPITGNTFEVLMFQKARLNRRARRFRRGAGNGMEDLNIQLEHAPRVVENSNSKLQVKPIPLTNTLLLNIISFSVFVALMAWLLGGPAEELFRTFNHTF
jgi:hypothetical protein